VKFGPIDTAQAEGAVLAHSIALPSGRLRKGLRLEPAHLAALRAAGIDRIIVAQLASGDVDENTAAAQVAQAVLAAHPHLTMTRAFTGRVNLLADGPGVRKPEDLLRYPLLHGRKSFPGENYPGWQEWFRAAGFEPPATPAGLYFDHHWMTVEAALEGQGIALAKRTIIESELKRGRLRRLLDFSYPLDFAYYLVYPGEIVPNSAAAAFREWVIAEACDMMKAIDR